MDRATLWAEYLSRLDEYMNARQEYITAREKMYDPSVWRLEPYLNALDKASEELQTALDFYIDASIAYTESRRHA
jgi:hypothetical protein